MTLDFVFSDDNNSSPYHLDNLTSNGSEIYCTCFFTFVFVPVFALVYVYILVLVSIFVFAIDDPPDLPLAVKKQNQMDHPSGRPTVRLGLGFGLGSGGYKMV